MSFTPKQLEQISQAIRGTVPYSDEISPDKIVSRVMTALTTYEETPLSVAMEALERNAQEHVCSFTTYAIDKIPTPAAHIAIKAIYKIKAMQGNLEKGDSE